MCADDPRGEKVRVKSEEQHPTLMMYIGEENAEKNNVGVQDLLDEVRSSTAHISSEIILVRLIWSCARLTSCGTPCGCF